MIKTSPVGLLFNMAKSKKSRDSVQQPTPPTQDEAEDADSDVEIVLDGEMERDEAELELERAVFGDSAGFREGLREVEQDQEETEEGVTGLEGLDDADVGQAALSHITTRSRY